jgi:beta-lactamase class A
LPDFASLIKRSIVQVTVLLTAEQRREGMSLKYLSFSLLAMVCLINLTFAQDDNRALLHRKLSSDIEKIANDFDGIMGVSIKDLTSGEVISANENLVFPTGSSIKIPILIELYKQAAEGKFRLTDQRWIEDKDKVGGSGVLLHFSNHASQLTLNDLAVLMIILSDNTATNMLIDQVGMANVNSTLDQIGLKQSRLRRKMIDQKASARGDENTSTPREAMVLMEKLYRGEIINKQLSEDLIKTLKLRKNSAITRSVPIDVEVANKPGGIEGAACDWGIVFVPNRPYVITVMTNYIGGSADEAIAKVSKLTYDYFARLARSTKYGARVPLEILQNKRD